MPMEVESIANVLLTSTISFLQGEKVSRGVEPTLIPH